MMPDPELSIRRGGIEPIGKYRNIWIFWMIEALGEKYGFTVDTPVRDIPEEVLNKIFFGSDEVLKLSNTPLGVSSNYLMTFEGVVNYVGTRRLSADARQTERGRSSTFSTIPAPNAVAPG